MVNGLHYLRISVGCLGDALSSSGEGSKTIFLQAHVLGVEHFFLRLPLEVNVS